MLRKIEKPIHDNFNDGFLFYGHKKTKRSSTGKRLGEEFNSQGKLGFEEMSYREADFRKAGILGATLDLKVKTRYPPSFKNVDKSKLTVVIDSNEYDVIHVDSNREKSLLFFYLQKVGVIDGEDI
ncbi:phage head closure protein (plasmid) [Bacillus carboniphilus]|uniref:Phage head closure protein n=1 Tax=Bacillus carboniphilus TaxID=86663 RepID=A0ABY9K0V9_9BACI|nr:phage head closure protein [Bacillus carboniphilus]WLR44477.1 phage head closure protein [Bacillus carboniphilus]